MYDVYDTIPEFLIALAQNDYMIDQHFLPDGKTLYQAAADVEALEVRVAELEAALGDLLAEYDAHLSETTYSEAARAALAAEKGDEDA